MVKVLVIVSTKYYLTMTINKNCVSTFYAVMKRGMENRIYFVATQLNQQVKKIKFSKQKLKCWENIIFRKWSKKNINFILYGYWYLGINLSIKYNTQIFNIVLKFICIMLLYNIILLCIIDQIFNQVNRMVTAKR